MKLNFWQWIGILLVVIAGIYIIRRETAGPTTPSSPAVPAQEATQPL